MTSAMKVAWSPSMIEAAAAVSGLWPSMVFMKGLSVVSGHYMVVVGDVTAPGATAAGGPLGGLQCAARVLKQRAYPPRVLACGEFCAERGRSSGVEHNLAKVGVVGSNPIARSSFS